jgi:hypothetical protein
MTTPNIKEPLDYETLAEHFGEDQEQVDYAHLALASVDSTKPTPRSVNIKTLKDKEPTDSVRELSNPSPVAESLTGGSVEDEYDREIFHVPMAKQMPKCEQCARTFISRNKLFAHLRTTNHFHPSSKTAFFNNLKATKMHLISRIDPAKRRGYANQQEKGREQ